ncbi:MAG: multidrug transporter, partial [Rhodospirillaceae bacterium]|nr:multidrug transporter [Rhodospirillaceae bacterium]
MTTTDDRFPDRFAAMLDGPILPMLARLSAPNVATAFAFVAMWVTDAWFIGRLGILPLASVALVFPVHTMMQMMSAGAMGGAVSSAIARALGAGDRDRADALVRHSAVIAAVMALLYLLLFGLFARPVFAALGGTGAVLDGAVDYAVIIFAGGITMWVANLFAAAIRGTGDMTTPAIWFCAGALLHAVLCGGLTLGWGPLPQLGLVGPAVSVTAAHGLIALMLGLNLLRGAGGVRLRVWGKLTGEMFRDILKVGLLGCGNSVVNIGTVLIVTRLVAELGAEALAGYGLGSRLELLIVPLAFGIGGTLTTSVGANFGAQQFGRARRIAWTGAVIAGGVTGAIGLAAALWPALWLDRFTADAAA